jgi:iron(III) transport system permease protein
MMYEDVIGLLDFAKGSVIGTVLLIPAFIAFIVDYLNREQVTSNYIKTPFSIKNNRIRDFFSYVCLGIISLFVLLPILTFAYLSFVRKYPMDLSLTIYHIQRIIELGGLHYLGNSLLIAFAGAFIGTFGAFSTAYLSARVKTQSSYFLHLMSITSLAIPGIVLGLSYVLFFNGSWIYGTLAMLILVNMVHFFASPYLMMYNTLNKMNRNLEDVGMILGVSRLNLICHVIVPQVVPTLKKMFAYLFVNSMMTISAVSFLSNVANKPIALMITQFEAIMMLECTAVVSLLILGINMLMQFGAMRE